MASKKGQGKGIVIAVAMLSLLCVTLLLSNVFCTISHR